MALPATAAFVGGFPGDDAKIEAVNALLASGSLAVFGGSATMLIAEMENLPYSGKQLGTKAPPTRHPPPHGVTIARHS